MRNEQSLDSLCAALAYAMGIEPPACAAAPVQALCDYVDEKLAGRKADRIFMYNPDAIAQWIQEKYPELMQQVTKYTELAVPYNSVFPPKTPVCFGTMYTGAQPEIHGIQKYEKPIIRIDTLFDALIRAGKKPAILAASDNCSLARIFLEREMDYFFFDTIEEVNAEAIRLIREDKYDFIVVYNGNYDSALHDFGPEHVNTLSELRVNDTMFGVFSKLIQEQWKCHDTLVAFAMDHGCHYTSMGKGSHGKDLDADMNIVHHYQLYPAE